MRFEKLGRRLVVAGAARRRVAVGGIGSVLASRTAPRIGSAPPWTSSSHSQVAPASPS